MRLASDPDRDHLIAIIAGATAEALRRSKSPKGWHEAQNEYINALEIWRRLGDQRREGDLLARLGRLQKERLADMHRAYATYRRAHALLAPLGEKRRDLRTLIALAEITLELGRDEEALGFQQEVLRIARELNDFEAQSVALNEIGNLEDLAGESLKAMTSYSQALEIWSHLADLRESSTTLRRRAQIYDTLGKYREALDDWERARALSLGKPSDQAAILTSMANTYIRLGQPSEALDLLVQALVLRKAIADQRGEAITETGLGFAYHRLGRLREAASHLEYALRLFQRFGSPADRVRALYDYGLALKDLGQLSEAAPLLAAAIEGGVQFGDDELVEAALLGLAQIRRTQGDLITALKLSNKAIESIENARGRPWSPNLRAAFFATKQNSYDFTIDLLMELDAKFPGSHYSVEAINLSERSRARALLERLQDHPEKHEETIPLGLASAKRRIEIALRSKSRLLIRERLSNSSRTMRLESEIRGLLSDYDRLNAEITATRPGYQALAQAQPLTLQQIQRQILDPETILLYYKLGKKKSYLWTVTSSSFECVTLPSRNVIELHAQRVYRLLASQASQEQTDLSLRRLSEILLVPIRKRLGSKRLLVVGEGTLQFIPFAALPLTSTLGRSRPLVVDHEIITMPSVSVLAMLQTQQATRQKAPGRLAIIADPVFSLDDPRVAVRLPLGLIPGAFIGTIPTRMMPTYRRLRYSRLEAEAISSLVAPQDRLTALDFAANRKLVLSGVLAGFQIVHFATHGEIDFQHPELSRLVLSLVDSEGRPQDGFLYAHEILGLRLPVELVVLSACKSGLGEEIRGEGVIGLPQAFLYAGATRVVASLWDVDDHATFLLFQSFYQHLFNDDMMPAQALRAAQIEQWEKQTSYSRWAAFTIQGLWH